MRARFSRARQRLGGLAIESMFKGLAVTAERSGPGRDARRLVETFKDIEYAPSGDTAHRLDVLRPKDANKPLPTMLYVHGGGFRILSKRTHWLMAARFAAQGFVVFNIDYRLAPAALFPAAIEDCSVALGWVLDNAARYGADPRRLVLAGESAGANLVCGLTLAMCSPRPEPYAAPLFERGVVPTALLPACGIHQVTDWERLRRRKPTLKPFVLDRLREVCEGYLGEDEPTGHAAHLADPVVALESGVELARPWPDTLAICGTKDPLLDDSRRLTQAIQTLGGHAELKIHPGEIHAFHAFVWRRAAQQAWAEQFEFLARRFPEHPTL